MPILGTWVTFLNPKNKCHLLPILRHFRPIHAIYTPFYAILRQQPCINESTPIKYTIWGTCKKNFNVLAQTV
jgi:hypothetical protein